MKPRRERGHPEVSEAGNGLSIRFLSERFYHADKLTYFGGLWLYRSAEFRY